MIPISRFLRVMVCLFVCICSFCIMARAETGPIVSMIDVCGNVKIPTEQILGAVSVTRIGQSLSTQAVEYDIESIMAMGSFADVQARTEKFTHGVKLVFAVVENPVFKAVRIRGLTRINPTEVERLFTQKPGEIFNTTTLRLDLEKVKQHFLKEKGLILSHKLHNGSFTDGIIELELIEQKVGQIKFEGLVRTKEFVLRRELSAKEGDIFDMNVVREDIQRLYRLQFFENIESKMEVSATPEAIDLIVSVKEAASTRNFEMGVSYAEESGELGGQVSYAENNLMGLGQSVSLNTEFTKSREKISINYANPWLDDKGTSLRVGLWESDSEITSTLNSWGINDSNYPAGEPYDIDLKRTGFSLSFGRKVWNDFRANLKLNIEKNTIENFYARSDSGRSNGLIRYLDQVTHHPGEFWDNTFAIELGQNKLIYEGQYFVKGGYQLFGSYSFSGSLLGSEYDYQSALLEGKWFHALGRNLVWGTRVQGALIRGDYPDYNQFYVGGRVKLRGYNDNRFYDQSTKSLIGSSYCLANTELRYRCSPLFGFAVFYDAGKVLDSPNGGAALRTDYGIGFRLNTPLGYFRVDRAWNGDGDIRDVISIGEMF